MMASMLGFGFLLGVRHALEADHVAAVAALSTRVISLRGLLGLAVSWGTGHALAILTIGSIAIALGAGLPSGSEHYLERLIGVVLLVMGLDVLRRTRSRRLHAHAHEHGDGCVHVHLHVHDEPTLVHGDHGHDHPGALRALAMGGLHGLAGSAALMWVAIPSGGSALGALVCLAAFGAGAIAGMMLFSLALSLPLHLAARGATAMTGLESALGVATLLVGLRIVVG